MFFETAEYPDWVALNFNDKGLIFKAGFTEPPGGQQHLSAQVLNDHSYCCQLSSTMCSVGGEPPLSKKEPCRVWHEQRIGTRSQDAARYGTPLIITEFGACMGS